MRPELHAVKLILDDVAGEVENGIPDAVLNRTRCLVVFPANYRVGVASCNDNGNDWSRPSLVAFSGKRVPGHDLLILVLGETEAKSLRDGGLRINTRVSPASAGPLAKSKPVITDADLHVGSLLYQRSGKVLAGTSAEGSITPARSEEQESSQAAVKDQELLESVRSFFNVITPVGIIIHHTAVLPTTAKVPTKKEVDAFHSEKGFDIVCFGREYHIAYHYLILEDGSIKAGRPERCQGAHAKGYNAYLGISVVGDFSSADNPDGRKGPLAPTGRQMQVLLKLCQQLRERYGIPPQRILRHSDVAATECPGDRFPFVQLLQMVGP